MNKAQTFVIWAFILALAGLLWSLSYALSYDIRVFLKSRKWDVDNNFFSTLSDDLLAPIRHAVMNWPPVDLLTQWPQSFVVQNTLYALVPVIILVLIALIIRSKLKMPDHLGTARLLKFSELGKVGLNKAKGFILGKAGNTRAIDEDQSHILVIGPPASGKTECLVIPNLVEWTGSFIAVDFKGTLFERTGKIRKGMGDEVFLLAPGFEESHTYNPLDLLRRGPEMITDVQALATLIVPVTDAKEAHWNQSAQMLLSGLLGYVLESKECENARCLSSVVDLFSATKSFSKTCEHMSNDPDISQWTRSRIIEFMAVPGDEAGSIRSTLNRHLMPWQNPAVAALTSSSGNAIPLDQIRKRRMAIYLIIDTGQIDIFAPVLKLFLEQVNSVVNRDYRAKDENKILFMIDEFYQLGRVKSIVSQLPFARDRDIRIVLVSQGIAQIDEKFGKDGRESIMASCALKLFCSFNDKPTVDLITHMAGTTTERVNTISRQMPLAGGLGRRTRNEQFTARPLFRPDDLYTWPRDDLLVMRTNTNPLIVKKVLADKASKYINITKKAAKHTISIPNLPVVETFKPEWGLKPTQAQQNNAASKVGKNAQTETQSIESSTTEPSSTVVQPDEKPVIPIADLVAESNVELDIPSYDELWDEVEDVVAAVKTSDTIEDKDYTLELFGNLREDFSTLEDIALNR